MFCSNIPYRVLTIDGGGSKGLYAIGALETLEHTIGCLHEKFDLIYGVSTGGIIAAGIALGRSISKIYRDYITYIPQIMRQKNRKRKSQALERALREIFGDKTLYDVKTSLCLIALDLNTKRPRIYKSNVIHSHGSQDLFKPGFDCTIVEILLASSAAIPFFEKKIIITTEGTQELVDGGYFANNPTLHAIIDAKKALKRLKKDVNNLQVINIGVGKYPKPNPKSIKELILRRTPLIKNYIKNTELILESQATGLEYLRKFIYDDVNIIHINSTFTKEEMATDFLEDDPLKLSMLYEAGKKSFTIYEDKIKLFFPECCSYENI